MTPTQCYVFYIFYFLPYPPSVCTLRYFITEKYKNSSYQSLRRYL